LPKTLIKKFFFHKETLGISKEKIMEKKILEILPGKGDESHGQA